MKFERVQEKGQFLGFRLQHKHVLFFFGSRHLNRDGLYDLHPECEFTFIKQVHGAKVVEASPATGIEADAQFSRQVTRAPVVVTADCAPVLLASKSQVCAIHAGWRSAAQGILKNCAPLFKDDPVLYAAIGPHIGSKSFEVGKDVAAQLTASLPLSARESRLEMPHPQSDKTFYDLNLLLHKQLRTFFGDKIEIFDCSLDTKTEPDFCSYRRDGPQAGRQFSFVVINS